MSFESETTAIAFNAFAQSCTLDGVEGLCIIDKSVSYVNDEGQVRDRITQASFMKPFGAAAKHGQTLVVGGETFKIGRRETDDGFITVFEVHAQ